jgi:plasmid replication initiation protein
MTDETERKAARGGNSNPMAPPKPSFEIQRVIVDVTPLQHLEGQVEEAGVVVAEWKNTIAKIETGINVANLALANAKKTREEHGLKAAMGDPNSVSEVKAARSAQTSAEQTITDLAEIALPAATEHLATAERNAAGARRAVAKLIAEGLMQQRIIVAGKIDEVISDFARLFGEYEKLGHAIANSEVMPQQNMFGSVSHDGAIGLRRVRAALPKFLDGVFPNSLHDEAKKEALAITEARQWGLAPEQSETKAA